jgi:dihydrolipoamide dehydrogenase
MSAVSPTALHCDVAIIGAGTAGLAAERSARRAGAKTLLIDDRFAGTTCASVGCMPSKLLIAASRAAHAVRIAPTFGIAVPAPAIDGAAVMARVRKERDAFVASTLRGIGQLPAGITLRAKAHFAERTLLALEDGRQVSATAIVIATGARPRVPKMFAALGDRVLTNETIFELARLPASIAVIGAGPLGLELGQALARLGVDTEIFDQGERLAALNDESVAAELRTILQGELLLRLGVSLTAEQNGNGALLSWTGPSSGTKRFERVLVATGRPPNLADLKLGNTGLALDDNGTPFFDRQTLQCGDAPIFIAGDADAAFPVLHKASEEGAIAGRNAATFPNILWAKRSIAFSIMFTDPPLAVLGDPPRDDDVVGFASFANQGRAKVEASNKGVIRVYADSKNGRLRGAAMVGPGTDHIAHLIAWAIERGETATALLHLPIYHPTYEEALKPALRQICETIGALSTIDQDAGISPGS